MGLSILPGKNNRKCQNLLDDFPFYLPSAKHGAPGFLCGIFFNLKLLLLVAFYRFGSRGVPLISALSAPGFK